MKIKLVDLRSGVTMAKELSKPIAINNLESQLQKYFPVPTIIVEDCYLKIKTTALREDCVYDFASENGLLLCAVQKRGPFTFVSFGECKQRLKNCSPAFEGYSHGGSSYEQHLRTKLWNAFCLFVWAAASRREFRAGQTYYQDTTGTNAKPAAHIAFLPSIEIRIDERIWRQLEIWGRSFILRNKTTRLPKKCNQFDNYVEGKISDESSLRSLVINAMNDLARCDNFDVEKMLDAGASFLRALEGRVGSSAATAKYPKESAIYLRCIRTVWQQFQSYLTRCSPTLLLSLAQYTQIVENIQSIAASRLVDHGTWYASGPKRTSKQYFASAFPNPRSFGLQLLVASQPPPPSGELRSSRRRVVSSELRQRIEEEIAPLVDELVPLLKDILLSEDIAPVQEPSAKTYALSDPFLEQLCFRPQSASAKNKNQQDPKKRENRVNQLY